jgi:hypothetical protein
VIIQTAEQNPLGALGANRRRSGREDNLVQLVDARFEDHPASGEADITCKPLSTTRSQIECSSHKAYFAQRAELPAVDDLADGPNAGVISPLEAGGNALGREPSARGFVLGQRAGEWFLAVRGNAVFGRRAQIFLASAERDGDQTYVHSRQRRAPRFDREARNSKHSMNPIGACRVRVHHPRHADRGQRLEDRQMGALDDLTRAQDADAPNGTRLIHAIVRAADASRLHGLVAITF